MLKSGFSSQSNLVWELPELFEVWDPELDRGVAAPSLLLEAEDVEALDELAGVSEPRLRFSWTLA
jgi:hypothetical protein